MAEQQTPKLIGVLAEHQQYFGAMSKGDAQWVIQNTATAIALFVSAVKMRNKGKSIIGSLVRNIQQKSKNIWWTAVAHSEEYASALRMMKVDIDTLKNKRMVIKVTTTIGVVYLVPEHTCGSPYGGDWQMILQARLEYGEQTQIGGGTTSVHILEDEMFAEVMQAIVENKTEIVSERWRFNQPVAKPATPPSSGNNDLTVVSEVIRDWRNGAGVGVVVPTILGMLEQLMRAYQNDFSADKAMEALGDLSKTAMQIRENISKAKSVAQS